VTHSRVRALDRRIALRLIGVDDGSWSGAVMDVSTQGFGFGIGFDLYSDLSGVAAHHADNGRTVIGIGAAPRALVGLATGWVSRITMRPALFPPRSVCTRGYHPEDG
jgi:hypothetical protein